MNQINNLTQFSKFVVVGVTNTIITLLAIWILVNLFLTTHYTANIVGYLLGVINSFFLNKIWTFNYRLNTALAFAKFIVVFGVTYLIQFSVLSLLLHFSKVEPFVCQILSMTIYTVLNYIINKNFTFKAKI